jgi:hypothetical protein
MPKGISNITGMLSKWKEFSVRGHPRQTNGKGMKSISRRNARQAWEKNLG